MAAETTPETPDDNTSPVPPRRSRWKLKLLGLFVIGLATAPSLITLSGQAQAVLARLHPSLARAVSFRSVTLHWWAPVELRGLRVQDLSEPDTGDALTDVPLLKAERVVTVEPLWQVLWNTGRGIGVHVVQPQLELKTSDSGSNLEHTLTAVFGESNGNETGRFPIRVTVEAGLVRIRSTAVPSAMASGPVADPGSRISSANGPTRVPVASRIELANVGGFVSLLDIDRWLPDVKLTADIRSAAAATDAQRSGTRAGTSGGARSQRLAAGLDEVVSDFPDVPMGELAGTSASGDPEASRIHIRLNPRADREGRQTIQIGARGLDLRLIQPLLDLAGMEVLTAGEVSGGIDARLAGATLSEGLAGRLLLAGDGVRVRQSSWAAGEWLPLNKVDAAGMVAIAEDGLLVQDLRVQTAVGELTGSGALRRAAATDSPADPQRRAGELELQGTLDLAQLAAALPKTLGLHQDLSVQRGAVELRVQAGDDSRDPSLATARDIAQDPVWRLALCVTGLEATRAGQPLTVAPDVRVAARGGLHSGWPALHQAAVSADFGELQLRPERDGWLVGGTLHPEPLWKQLQQFADVPAPGLTSSLALQTHVAFATDRIRFTETEVNSADITVRGERLEILTNAPGTACLNGSMTLEGRSAAVRTLLAPWHDMWWLAKSSQVTASLSADPQNELALQVRIRPGTVTGLSPGELRTVKTASGSQAASSTRPAAQTKAPVADNSLVTIDEGDVDLQFRVQQSGRELTISSGRVQLPGLESNIAGTVTMPDDDVRVDLTAETQYDLDVLSRRWLPADSGVLLAGRGRDNFRIAGSPSAINGTASRGGRPGLSVSEDRVLRGSGTVQWSQAGLFGLQAGPATIAARLENELLRADPVRCSVSGGELSVMPQYDLLRSQLQLGSGSRIQNLQLSPSLCRQWLAYVTPLLADSAEVSGTVSARVERFLWDFEFPERSAVTGELTIHQAQAAAGSSLAPLLQVAEMLRQRGQNSEPLSARTLILPAQTIPVQIREGSVLHEGLTMELSGYRMVSSGLVGFDERLQMQLQVPLEKSTAGNSGRSVPVALRGTIRRPQPDTAALLQAIGVQKLQEKLGGSVNDRLNQELDKGLGRLLDKL